MYIRYRLEKIYGLPGVITGLLIAILGSCTIFMSWSGVVLIIVGLWFSGTDRACVVDTKKYRVSFDYLYFWILNAGKWLYVRADMMLKINETKKPFRIICSSNRIIDVSGSKYVIYLMDYRKKKKYLVMKSKTKEKAEAEIDRLSDLLGIGIVEDTSQTPKKILHL